MKFILYSWFTHEIINKRYKFLGHEMFCRGYITSFMISKFLYLIIIWLQQKLNMISLSFKIMRGSVGPGTTTPYFYFFCNVQKWQNIENSTKCRIQGNISLTHYPPYSIVLSLLSFQGTKKRKKYQQSTGISFD